MMLRDALAASSFVQTIISVAAATILAVLAFRPILNARMAVYVREYPHDGQDSLGAAMDALGAFVLIEVCCSLLLYFLQRKFVPSDKDEINGKDGPSGEPGSSQLNQVSEDDQGSLVSRARGLTRQQARAAPQ